MPFPRSTSSSNPASQVAVLENNTSVAKIFDNFKSGAVRGSGSEFD